MMNPTIEALAKKARVTSISPAEKDAYPKFSGSSGVIIVFAIFNVIAIVALDLKAKKIEEVVMVRGRWQAGELQILRDWYKKLMRRLDKGAAEM